MKPVITVMTACTLSLLGTVVAQQPQTPEQQSRQGIPATRHQEEALREIKSDLFNRLDADRNGLISRQEAQAESSLSGSLSEYDENGDQALDPKEFAAFEEISTASAESEDLEAGQTGPTEEGLPTTRHQQQVVRDDLVERLDKDGDGGISQQEAQSESRLTAEWDQLDRNDDGKLDSSELGRLEH